MFWHKAKGIKEAQETPEVKIRVTLTNGKVVTGTCYERDYVLAKDQLGWVNPKPDSLIYILNVIAHVSEFKSIEFIERV